MILSVLLEISGYIVSCKFIYYFILFVSLLLSLSKSIVNDYILYDVILVWHCIALALYCADV